jgi:cobalt-zinc-cadmium efflux system protein
LIKDCFRLWLDGVSEKININKIKTIATKLNDVKDLHHIHIWAINTTENALTGHLVLELGLSIEDE